MWHFNFYNSAGASEHYTVRSMLSSMCPQEQTHADRREVIRLKEELLVYKTKAERLSSLQSAMRTQEHKLEDIDAAMKKITVSWGEGRRRRERKRERMNCRLQIAV